MRTPLYFAAAVLITVGPASFAQPAEQEQSSSASAAPAQAPTIPTAPLTEKEKFWLTPSQQASLTRSERLINIYWTSGARQRARQAVAQNIPPEFAAEYISALTSGDLNAADGVLFKAGAQSPKPPSDKPQATPTAPKLTVAVNPSSLPSEELSRGERLWLPDSQAKLLSMSEEWYNNWYYGDGARQRARAMIVSRLPAPYADQYLKALGTHRPEAVDAVLFAAAKSKPDANSAPGSGSNPAATPTAGAKGGGSVGTQKSTASGATAGAETHPIFNQSETAPTPLSNAEIAFLAKNNLKDAFTADLKKAGSDPAAVNAVYKMYRQKNYEAFSGMKDHAKQADVCKSLSKDAVASSASADASGASDLSGGVVDCIKNARGQGLDRVKAHEKCADGQAMSARSPKKSAKKTSAGQTASSQALAEPFKSACTTLLADPLAVIMPASDKPAVAKQSQIDQQCGGQPCGTEKPKEKADKFDWQQVKVGVVGSVVGAALVLGMGFPALAVVGGIIGGGLLFWALNKYS